MKSKFFKALVLAATLLAAGPAFARDGRGGGGGSNGGGRSSGGGRSFGTTPSIAYGGHGYSGSYGGGYGRGGGYGYGGYGHYGGYGRGGYYYNGGWVYPGYVGYPYYGYDYYDAPNYVYSDSSDTDTGGSLTAEVQSDLAHTGYYKGAIDGVAGPATQTAISAYQRDEGLAVTGTITGGLLKSLGMN